MSVILVDEPTERDLQVNGWNWGVLHALVEAGGVLPTERWAPARSAGCGARLEPSDVRALVRFLEVILNQLGSCDRIDNELEATNAALDRQRLRFDAQQNYSLERHVLESVIDFLCAADGAVSIA